MNGTDDKVELPLGQKNLRLPWELMRIADFHAIENLQTGFVQLGIILLQFLFAGKIGLDSLRPIQHIAVVCQRDDIYTAFPGTITNLLQRSNSVKGILAVDM
jgi:hypothetical protein